MSGLSGTSDALAEVCVEQKVSFAWQLPLVWFFVSSARKLCEPFRHLSFFGIKCVLKIILQKANVQKVEGKCKWTLELISGWFSFGSNKLSQALPVGVDQPAGCSQECRPVPPGRPALAPSCSLNASCARVSLSEAVLLWACSVFGHCWMSACSFTNFRHVEHFSEQQLLQTPVVSDL